MAPITKGVLIVALVVTVVACRKIEFPEPEPPPPPTVVILELMGAADLNADAQGRGAPLAVRIYQLASAEVFSRADFFQVYDQAQASLGVDLIAQETRVLAPGGQERVPLMIKQGTQFIGIVGAFRDINQSVWRLYAPVVPQQTTTYRLIFGDGVITPGDAP
ncbi:MAG: type VI secretion system lipoprotein TssJ [Pseudomonadota bacterium]